MTPDQYRRAPIPADGRTIEAMRLSLLDTPAGRSMTNAGDTRLYWMNESDAYMLMSHFDIESPFINTPDAVARLGEANERYVVWSHEHAAWWRPNSAGYCNDVRAAGVYSRAEAISISHKFRDHWREGTRPDELAVRVTDLPEWAQDALAAMETNHDKN